MNRLNLNQYRQHVFTTLGAEMRELSKPLLDYGITHFSQSVIHPGKEFEILTTHPEVSVDFVREKFYEFAFSGDLEDYTTSICLWRDLQKENDPRVDDGLEFLSHRHHLAHGLVVTHKLVDRCIIYYFAADPNSHNMHFFYLNNFHLIEAFIAEFNDKARSLLCRSSDCRFYIPDGNDNTALTSVASKAQHYKNINQCQHDVSFDKHIVDLCARYQFTKREHQCAFYLRKGVSSKCIAMQLSISVRTVEKYIEGLKSKLSVRTINQLIASLCGVYLSNNNSSLMDFA